MSNRYRKTIPSDWLHVATLGRTVGLKGDMKLNLATDFPEQFVPGAVFNLEDGSTVTVQNFNAERELIRLKGIETPESAKPLTNARLYTTYEATREQCGLEDGEFFWFDLLGLAVEEAGMILGKVQEIERIGAQDYLLVATDPSLVSKGLPATFLIPYIDRFIEKCDTDSKVISVKGGLDLLEAS